MRSSDPHRLREFPHSTPCSKPHSSSHREAYERRWIRLIEALHRTGRAHEALVLHRRVVVTLRDELGLEPSPELARTEYRILDGVEDP